MGLSGELCRFPLITAVDSSSISVRLRGFRRSAGLRAATRDPEQPAVLVDSVRGAPVFPEFVQALGHDDAERVRRGDCLCDLILLALARGVHAGREHSARLFPTRSGNRCQHVRASPE
jgi:hypothetical protein